MDRLRLFLSSLLVSAVASTAAHAVPYDFLVIASSAVPPFSGIVSFSPPSINADGAVAFLGSAPSTGTAIFTASQRGSSLADYLQISGRPGQVALSIVAIGSFVGDFVAFRADDQGVYRGEGGPLALLYGPVDSIDPPAVNALGEVVFVEDRKLVLADVQGSSILFEKDDMAAGGTIFDIPDISPDINDTSQVAFYADIDFDLNFFCDEAFMRSISGGAEVIALGHDELCDFNSSGLVPLAINESGSVAYAPKIFDAAGDVQVAFVDSTKVWDERTPGFGASPSVFAVALNDAGQVALQVESTSGSGIYTGGDPVADKVLASGDLLCDATVTDIDFQRFGQNNARQFALLVSLSDGRRLVVRADPSSSQGGQCITVPEPATLLAVGAAALVLAALRCRADRAPRRGGAAHPR
jgi:hypothetical protein